MMDVVLLIARLVLAAVFAVSGIAKLADRPGSRQAMIDFGVPDRWAAPLGRLLPIAELGVALALLAVATAWWGALGAFVLLVGFTVGISVNLARGRRPACHCFGQLSSEPIGWGTLARNGVLLAISSLVLWQGHAGASLGGLLLSLTPMQWVVVITGGLGLGLLAGLSWLLLSLWQQQGRLLARIEALEAGQATPSRPPTAGLVGTKAPNFGLRDLKGEMVTLDATLSPGKPALLIFTDPACGSCNTLLPKVSRWQKQYTAWLTVALISRGSAADNRTKTKGHDLVTVLLQKDFEVAKAYKVDRTPSAVFIRPDGTISSEVIGGAHAITSFVAELASRQRPNAAQAPAVQVGQAAPNFALANLEGRSVSLADFRGNDLLLLFWNPGCGFCQRMLPELQALEAQRPEGSPQWLVISGGSLEANRAMGLRSPIVLDSSFAVGRAFGAGGTPSAVRIDAEGKVASKVAVGAPAVLELARGKAAVALT